MNVCLASSNTGSACLVRAVWQSKQGLPRRLVPVVGWWWCAYTVELVKPADPERTEGVA